MTLALADLLASLGPIVQDRQLYLADKVPGTTQNGFELDMEHGTLTFPGGAPLAIQVIGSASQGSWLWAWANPSIRPALTQLVEKVHAWGEPRKLEDLTSPGFMVEDKAGAVYTALNAAAVAVGLTQAPGLYCCHDRDRGVRLYVALVDDALVEPPGNPLLRIVQRYPKILALAGKPPYDGGIPVGDWAVGLASYAASLGILCEPLADAPVGTAFALRNGSDTLIARFDDAKLAFDLAGVAR